ncbi:MAG: winged helix-turn-helix transcriptional regulator [Arcobacteraceae bacterium]
MFSEVPPNVVYFLTPVGEKLRPILNEMFIGKLIMSHYMVQ